METSRSSPAWLARYPWLSSAKIIARFLGERLERLSTSQCFIGHEGLLAIATQCSSLVALDIPSEADRPAGTRPEHIHPRGRRYPGGGDARDLPVLHEAGEAQPGRQSSRRQERRPHLSCDRLRHLRPQVNNLTDAVVPAPMRLRHLSTLALVSNDGQSFRDCVPVRPRVRERTETQSYSKTRGDSAAVDGAHARTQPVRRTHNGDRVRRGAPIRARASAEIAYSK